MHCHRGALSSRFNMSDSFCNSSNGFGPASTFFACLFSIFLFRQASAHSMNCFTLISNAAFSVARLRSKYLTKFVSGKLPLRSVPILCISLSFMTVVHSPSFWPSFLHAAEDQVRGEQQRLYNSSSEGYSSSSRQEGQLATCEFGPAPATHRIRPSQPVKCHVTRRA